MSAAPRTAARLENGDRLTRYEFHRLYLAHPEIRKAELIEGVVYVPSPARAREHGIPQSRLAGWLLAYEAATPGLLSATDATVLLDFDNELQPDICLWREGGTARINESGYIEGAPDLVVEITASTASIDLHAKKDAYRRNGVKEYVVWRTDDAAVDWFELEDGEYVRLEPNAAGVIESREFPGLRLPVAALLAGDLQALLGAVQG
jgi:Uma2 family endonuclease